MDLAGVLGHTFQSSELLELALTHRSVSSDHPDRNDNERLEFLGDAVLQLVVTDRLYNDFPDLAEGKLAKVRAAVVSGATLADVAGGIRLGDFLDLSPSEERSGGRAKDSILADALEAVIGAVYLDAGFPAAAEVVLRLFGSRIEEKAANPGIRDYKTRLQEVLAAVSKRPRYEVTGSGPDHRREFNARVFDEGDLLGEGKGRSKKAAEQAAAEEALRRLS